jgi:uncharacterized protein (TIGR03067 family)
MRSHLLMVLGVALLAGAAAGRRGGTEGDAARIQGRWTVVAVEEDGRQRAVTKADVLVITGDTITEMIDGRPQGVGYRLGPAKEPKAIDIGLPAGLRRCALIRAIYTLEGDALTICYDLDGEPRPTEFTARKGSHQGLMTLERE